ncbi:MAG TPA: IPT/TIG domain-containing protein [Pyrinomonadaceae bacterium]
MAAERTLVSEERRQRRAEEARYERKELQLNRALNILAVYYIVLPILLIYLLFKIFPPQPWYPPDWRAVQMVFFIPKLNIWTTLEERLILLVAVAGALGSYIHTATSYADYRGNQRFGASWLVWYLLRPFIGMSLALVVYFAIRGGLLSIVLSGNEANDATKINPFGIGAISCLTGMFSKQAADKLAEVFSTLFKSGADEARKDSLTPKPEISAIDPAEGPVAGGNNVTITGAGFVTGTKVFVGGNPATNVTIVNDSTLTADVPAGGAGTVDVEIANEQGHKATLTGSYTYVSSNEDRSTSLDEVETEVETTDGCDVDIIDETPDEDLPRAGGGVA